MAVSVEKCFLFPLCQQDIMSFESRKSTNLGHNRQQRNRSSICRVFMIVRLGDRNNLRRFPGLCERIRGKRIIYQVRTLAVTWSYPGAFFDGRLLTIFATPPSLTGRKLKTTPIVHFVVACRARKRFGV